MVVPVTLIYDREPVFHKTELLHERIPEAYIALHITDARKLEIADGDMVSVMANGRTINATAYIDDHVLEGTALLPRALQRHGSLATAQVAQITRMEKAEA